MKAHEGKQGGSLNQIIPRRGNEDENCLLLKNPIHRCHDTDAILNAILAQIDSRDHITIHGSFVKSLESSWRLKVWEAIGKSKTITSLKLTRFLTGTFPLEATVLAETLKSPLRNQLKSLYLTAVDLEGSPQEVKAFLDALKDLSKLTMIVLDDVYISGRGIDSLIQQAASLASLESMQVVQIFQRGGDLSLETIQAISCHGSLKALKFAGVRLGEDLVDALTGGLRAKSCLQELNLDNALISRRSFQAFAHMLATNTSLQKLELFRIRRAEFLLEPYASNQGMDDETVVQFAEALKHNTSLKALYVSPVGAVSSAGYQSIADMLERSNRTLEEIVVAGGVPENKHLLQCRLLLQLNRFGMRGLESSSRVYFLESLIKHKENMPLDCLFYVLLLSPTLVDYLY